MRTNVNGAGLSKVISGFEARLGHFNFFLHNSVLFMSRDKLTSDECIGTHYLPMSAISGQGEEGLYDICAQLIH